MKFKTLLLLTTLILARSSVEAQQISIARNKPVSGFPLIVSNPFEYLVDGNDMTLWPLPEASITKYVDIDLQGAYWVDRVLLKNHINIKNIKIAVKSKDGLIDVFTGKVPEKYLISFDPVKTTGIRIEFPVEPYDYAGKAPSYIGDVEIYSYEPQPVMVNQTGYNTLDFKRFTAPLAKDGTPFSVMDSAGREVYKGIVQQHIGDFSAFNPESRGPYYVEVKSSIETGRSFQFNIEPYLIERASYAPAMAFMADVRCWYGCADDYSPTERGPGCPFLGVAWRDSHQFSFEIPALLSMYFANPQAFSQERLPDHGIYKGLREELPANTPEIIKMVYWATDIYLRGKVNHTFLKAQLAWFIYSWPHLSKYIPKSVYDEAVNYLFPIWGNAEKDRWNWHDIDHSADLFQTYKIIGPGKGQFPAGFSIIPNLMMYEVALREKRTGAEKFFQSAYNQTAWIIANLDWNDPATTKGQRMNEYITLDALSYFLKQYPDKAPKGLTEKIKSWADVAIKRADNMWDYRMYSSDQWTIPDVLYPNDPKFNPHGSFNEPGNIAGFPVPALAAAQVLKGSAADQAKANRLRTLATAHMDHVFGRNPAGRHFSYDAVTDFEGADLGWFREWEGGAGMLQTARGVLDGSVKEIDYPYNPYGGDPGHSEGWVTFNTAWMMGIAYKTADQVRIELYDDKWKTQIQTSFKDGHIGIRLYAPLNFNPAKLEDAEVHLTNKKGDVWAVLLKEVHKNGLYFDSVIDLSDAPYRIAQNEELIISYGLEHFSKSAKLKIK